MKINEALFKLDGKNLYREQNLVIVQVPIFFVCEDEDEHRYLVLLLDFYSDEYLICPISNEDLLLMLTGKITMRKPFITAKDLYWVKAGDSLDKDDVKKVNCEDLEKDFLPEENAIFEIGEDEGLKAYILKLKELKPDLDEVLIEYDKMLSNYFSKIIENINAAETLKMCNNTLSALVNVAVESVSTVKQAFLEYNVPPIMEVDISTQLVDNNGANEYDGDAVSLENRVEEKVSYSFSYSSDDMETSYYYVDEQISIKVA